jgi:DNA polymerase-3 subunit delta'
MSFCSVFGQDRAVAQLKSLLLTGKVPHGLLFSGPEGVGKTIAAQEFAKALNCLSASVNPGDSCGECSSCVQIEKGVHPDVRKADFDFQAALRQEPPEKQQHVRIETIRALTAMAQQKNMSARWKVFIICNAHIMLSEAANALLKLLEEPPPRTVWILISRSREVLLPTIISRCQSVRFHPLTGRAVTDILMEKSVDFEHAKRLAAVCGGSVSRALRLNELLDKYSALDGLDPAYPFKAAALLPKGLVQAREEAGLLLELMAENMRLKWLASRRGRQYGEVLEYLLKCRRMLAQNVNPRLVFESAAMEVFDLNMPVVSI